MSSIVGVFARCANFRGHVCSRVVCLRDAQTYRVVCLRDAQTYEAMCIRGFVDGVIGAMIHFMPFAP